MSLSTNGSEPSLSRSSWFGILPGKIVPLSNKLSYRSWCNLFENRFRFSNDVRLISEGNGQVPGFTTIANASEDPKLIAHYFTLPIVFNWKITKTFHMTLGGLWWTTLVRVKKIKLKEQEEELKNTDMVFWP